MHLKYLQTPSNILFWEPKRFWERGSIRVNCSYQMWLYLMYLECMLVNACCRQSTWSEEMCESMVFFLLHYLFPIGDIWNLGYLLFVSVERDSCLQAVNDVAFSRAWPLGWLCLCMWYQFTGHHERMKSFAFERQPFLLCNLRQKERAREETIREVTGSRSGAFKVHKEQISAGSLERIKKVRACHPAEVIWEVLMHIHFLCKVQSDKVCSSVLQVEREQSQLKGEGEHTRDRFNMFNMERMKKKRRMKEVKAQLKQDINPSGT